MSLVTIFGFVAMYIVAWAICLFMVLPWGAHSQSDADQVVAGTDPGAPAVFSMWKKLIATTVLAAIFVALIAWGVSSPLLQRYWR